MGAMSPIVITLALAILIGVVARGSFRNFERVHIHWWGFAIGGVALQVLPAATIGRLSAAVVGTAMLVGSYVLVLVFLAANRWVPAARLMAIGLLLNLVVVACNGGMPVTGAAIEESGGSPATLAGGEAAKHHLASDDDLFVLLGDVIPVPQPVGVVLSIGDVLLYAGMAWFVIQVMRGRSRENPRPLVVWFPGYRGKHAPAYWRMPARYRARDRVEAAPSGTER
jgi:hypothetical protein